MDQVVSYATLQEAVAGLLHRPNDTNLTGNLPLFVQLCEADLNDRLLLKDMESDEALTLTTSQNYVALPTGFVSPIAFWLVIAGLRTPLQFILAHELPYHTDATQPSVVAVDGANLRFDCPAGDNYSAFLRCVKRSNLSVSTTTNALLLKRPDVYVFGTLKQACLWINDDANAQKWGAMYENAIKGLKAADSRNRSVAPLRSELADHRSNIFAG
jgi:hypothetical protein